MAKQETRKATLNQTGQELEVYRSKVKQDTWVSYPDCSKEFKEDELTFKD